MYRQISSFFGSLANFVFPPFCSYCHLRASEGLVGGICQDCWATVKIWENGQCQRCGQPVAEAESCLITFPKRQSPESHFHLHEQVITASLMKRMRRENSFYSDAFIPDCKIYTSYHERGVNV